MYLCLSEAISGNNHLELMHENNVFLTTTSQVLAKRKIRESDGREVFFAFGLANKLVLEVLLFLQYKKKRITLCASLATLTFKR